MSTPWIYIIIVPEFYNKKKIYMTLIRKILHAGSGLRSHYTIVLCVWVKWTNDTGADVETLPLCLQRSVYKLIWNSALSNVRGWCPMSKLFPNSRDCIKVTIESFHLDIRNKYYFKLVSVSVKLVSWASPRLLRWNDWHYLTSETHFGKLISTPTKLKASYLWLSIPLDFILALSNNYVLIILSVTEIRASLAGSLVINNAPCRFYTSYLSNCFVNCNFIFLE
jgi:hypothetical protein